jgi:hypothetical protein
MHVLALKSHFQPPHVPLLTILSDDLQIRGTLCPVRSDRCNCTTESQIFQYSGLCLRCVNPAKGLSLSSAASCSLPIKVRISYLSSASSNILNAIKCPGVYSRWISRCELGILILYMMQTVILFTADSNWARLILNVSFKNFSFQIVHYFIIFLKM